VASKKITWIGRVISILVCLMFLFSASFKFIDGPQVKEGFTHLGLPERMMLPLGILELACVVIYILLLSVQFCWPGTSVARSARTGELVILSSCRFCLESSSGSGFICEKID
jgi:hypothetical protein